MRKTYPNANSTTRKDRIVEVKAVWAHCFKRGLIRLNPLSVIRAPTAEMRTHHVPFSRWPELLAACPNDQLRGIVEFMLYTGARTQEATILDVADWDGRCFTLSASRAKGNTERIIHVPTFLCEKLNGLAVGAKGRVFKNTDGNPWNKDSLNCAFCRLKEKLKDPELCATSCRHSFATWKLDCEVPIETIAKLMGHASTRMVYSRYGKFHKTKLLTAGVNAGL